MSIVDAIIAKATDAATDLINFDDINIITLKATAEKFEVWDDILNLMPTEIRNKIEDGTISNEELKSLISVTRDIIMKKVAGSADTLDATTEAAADVVEEAAA